MSIDITDLTNNVSTSNDFVVTGDGVLDDLMETANAHIKAQYDAGRIKGEDYANVYLGMYQANLASAVQIILQKALIEAQTAGEVAKTALIIRQTKGFDDDARQKLIKIIVDAWSVMATIVKPSTTAMPNIFANQHAINDVLEKAFNGIGVTITSSDFDSTTSTV